MLDKFRDLPDQVKFALAAYNAGAWPRRRSPPCGPEGRHTHDLCGHRAPTPPETQQYVGRVLSPRDHATRWRGAGAQQQAEAQTKIAATWQKQIEDTLTQFGVLQKQVEALNQSGANFGGIMSRDVAQAAERVVQKLVEINQAFATLPALSDKLPASLREQVVQATQQAAVWKEMLLTDQQRAALLDRQVESMEQVVSRQKAQLISQREGQEAAERFARLDAARLAAAKIDERVERAALTLTQQIAADGAKLQLSRTRPRNLAQSWKPAALRPCVRNWQASSKALKPS